MNTNKTIVAFVYDYDHTLCTTDMQNYSFIPSLHIKPAEFWSAANDLSKRENMEPLLAYMYLMIEWSKKNQLPINREAFVQLGKDIEYFPGVETWFKRIDEYGASKNVEVQHYVISSGNKEIVEGCQIADKFKQIYGCEYIFDKVSGEVIWPKLAINYTQKTQYFFRISKGVYDATDDAGVNEKKPERRIPYSNMIYIGDGMTDIPSMIIVKNNGGKSIAVYPKGNEDRVASLYEDGRVNYSCVADYSAGKDLEKVLHLIIQGIAINESLKLRENQNPFLD